MNAWSMFFMCCVKQCKTVHMNFILCLRIKVYLGETLSGGLRISEHVPNIKQEVKCFPDIVSYRVSVVRYLNEPISFI